MKKTLPVFLILLFAFEMVNAQVADPEPINPQQEMYDFYSVKHKKSKKTGFILLGAGVASIAGALVIAYTSDSLDGLAPGAILFTLGTLSAIASIPVFISSGAKKRKANTYLEGGIGRVGNITFNNSRYASIGLKIVY